MAHRLNTSDNNAKSNLKKIQARAANINDETGEEYAASDFGGFRDYFRRKKIKLQNQDADLRSSLDSSSYPQIFAGLIIFINGYTQPSISELRQLIVQHGGIFLQYMEGKTNVTHIIASSLTPKKRVEFANYKVAKPQWIVQSTEAGKLLPWDNFRVFDAGEGQSTLNFEKMASTSTSTATVTRTIGKAIDQIPRHLSQPPPPLPPATASSKISRHPNPPESSTSYSIPPSDEVEAEEEYELNPFPSYQLPAKSTATSSNDDIPSSQEAIIIKELVEDGSPGHQKPRKVYSFLGDSPNDKRQEEDLEEDLKEDEDIVNLVPIPSASEAGDNSPSKSPFPSSIKHPPSPKYPSLKRPPPNSNSSNAPDTSQPDSNPPPTALINGVPAYEVSRIMGVRKRSKKKPKYLHGKLEYLVEWKGYSEDDATWELAHKLKVDLGEGLFDQMVKDFEECERRKIEGENKESNDEEKKKKADNLEKEISVGDSFRISQKLSQPTPPPDDLDIMQLEAVESGTSNTNANILSPEASSPLSLERFEKSPQLEQGPSHQVPPSTFVPESELQHQLEPGKWEKSSPILPASLPCSSPPPSALLSMPSVTKTSPKKRQWSPKESDADFSPSPKIKKSKGMTAEEYNTELLSDPKVREASVLNPEFMKKYGESSRLHHLSTWKAELQIKVAALVEQSSSQKPPAQPRPRRYILHIDLDCFFASIALLSHPELVAKPVAICHSSSPSSEIASCNYVARSFGVKNGMWFSRAKALCPALQRLGYSFTQYQHASEEFYSVVVALGGERVQAVSVDEALVDISNLCITDGEDEDLEWKRAEDTAQKVRKEIKAQIKCDVSVGIGPSILLARLAMRKAKPAGQFTIRTKDVKEFLDNVEIAALPGIGGSIAGKIEEKFGAKKCGEVRENVVREQLKRALGEKTGSKIWSFVRGIDLTQVGEAKDVGMARKSVGVDVNWGVRFENQAQAETFIHSLAEEVIRRLKLQRLLARQLSLKINKRAADAPLESEKFLGCGRCDTVNRSVALGVAMDDVEVVAQQAVGLLRGARISPGELRGLGISLGGLEDAGGSKLGMQKRLDFGKAAVKKMGEKVEAQALETKVKSAVPEMKVKAYVPPKLTTLMDSFVKKESTQKGLPPIPPPPKVPPPKIVTEPEMLFTGTQIDIPSQVDPTVLPYLPAPLRAAIERKQAAQKADQEALQQIREEHSSSQYKGKGKGKMLSEPEIEKSDPPEQAILLPPPDSGYDYEIWNELDEDTKKILIAEHEDYRYHKEGLRQREKEASVSPSKRAQARSQPAPSRSPRKNHMLPRDEPGSPSEKVSTPTSQKKFPGPKPQPKSQRIYDGKGNDVTDWLFTDGGVDRDWFEAVDPDSRLWAIAEAYKTRNARQAEKEKQRQEDIREEQRRRALYGTAARLPPSPKLAVLWGKAQTIEEVRLALDEWVGTYLEEGPPKQMVDELYEYVKYVVVMEKDAVKAEMVEKWIDRLVWGMGKEEIWEWVVERVRRGVDDGLAERGMGPLKRW